MHSGPEARISSHDSVFLNRPKGQLVYDWDQAMWYIKIVQFICKHE
jgi:hypothetical protein